MDDEFKKLERLYHRFYDEDGKLRKITSSVNVKGVVTYVMERPKVKTPSDTECRLHEYEDVSSFLHDYEQCKLCKHKKYR